MRIKSYLAILILICLGGGYALDQVLSYETSNTQKLAEQYNGDLLWAKDLKRINDNTAQYLISTDLILASGNTYLLQGTSKMGRLLINDIGILAQRPNMLSNPLSLTDTIDEINTINGLLKQVNESDADFDTLLSSLLPKYDRQVTLLTRNLKRINQESSLSIEKKSQLLQQKKSTTLTISFYARGLFLLLIIMLWFWANKKICTPLLHLKQASAIALSGGEFSANIKRAPQEIIELSDDFKILTDSLFHQASHDPLTGLKNRRYFERLINNNPKNEGHIDFVCFIDLDYFKTINDTCGHAAGDSVLIRVADILTKGVRGSDEVARLGGDEFALLLVHCDTEQAKQVTSRIREEISQITYTWEDEVFHLSASIGIASTHNNNKTVTDLLNFADLACCMAKEAGRNKIHLFDDSTEFADTKRSDMLSVNKINSALANNLFVLYKQDITPLSPANNSVHFEILLRMTDINGKMISPDNFLPAAERYQLSSAIDSWVINEVLHWFSEHPTELMRTDLCSINLSAQSLGKSEMELFIVEKIHEYNIPPEKICFEITETAAITNLNKAKTFIESLRSLGCKFALDDFGSGHSSYSHIKELPTDTIKIDGSFVSDMLNNPVDYATVKSICDISKALGQSTIAEYVETQEVVEALQKLGVDYAQGYYFSRPEPLNKDNVTQLRVVKS